MSSRRQPDRSEPTHDERAHMLAALVESSEDAIVSKDLNGTITSWNKAAERLFGYSANEAIGQPVSMLIPPDRTDEGPDILARIRNGEHVRPYETARQCKDGRLIEISLTVSPILDAAGRVIGASKIARDITERRIAEDQRMLLLREMRHRLKNTLAIVQAIAGRTLKSVSKEEKGAFEARVNALAAAQDLLSLDNWKTVLLRDIIERTLVPFHPDQRERIVLSGPPDAALSTGKVTLLAMALHELATNAMKYGALSNDDGLVHITWKKIDGYERINFVWRETGGPSVKPPTHRGFGTILLERALESELGGTYLDFRPEGLCCIFDVRV